MKVRSVGTHLHLICAEPESGTALAYEAYAMPWKDPSAFYEDQEVSEHGIHSEQWWQNNRENRVRTLRAQVKSGTYRVDRIDLAECILKDEVRL